MPTMPKQKTTSPITSSVSTTASVSIQHWATCRPTFTNGKWQNVNLSLCPKLLDHSTAIITDSRHTTPADEKKPHRIPAGFSSTTNNKPDNILLSHWLQHYHRRKVVSRSCSGWEGVGPTCYGHQALTCTCIVHVNAALNLEEV